MTLETLTNQLDELKIDEIIAGAWTTTGGSSGERGELTWTTYCNSDGHCKMALVWQYE